MFGFKSLILTPLGVAEDVCFNHLSVTFRDLFDFFAGLLTSFHTFSITSGGITADSGWWEAILVQSTCHGW